MSVSLGGVLNLARMDRVQVLSQRTIREARLGRIVRPGVLLEPEYPYWFFQCVDTEGRLVLRSPGGYMEKVDPLDVCDIQAGNPLRVRAMPRTLFLERLSRPVTKPGVQFYVDADFYWATVMFVSKDKWGRVDRVHVLFDDDRFNDDERWPTFSVPVLDEDRRMLNMRARRTILPVIGARCAAGFSADHGLAAAERKHAREVRGFIRKRVVVRRAHQVKAAIEADYRAALADGLVSEDEVDLVRQATARVPLPDSEISPQAYSEIQEMVVIANAREPVGADRGGN